MAVQAHIQFPAIESDTKVRIDQTEARAEMLVGFAQGQAHASILQAQAQAHEATLSHVEQYRLDVGSRAKFNISYTSIARVKHLDGEMEAMRGQNEMLLGLVQQALWMAGGSPSPEALVAPHLLKILWAVILEGRLRIGSQLVEIKKH